MDVLQRIKRLVLQGRIGFAAKARDEMQADGLHADDIIETIVTASSIAKTIRSKSGDRRYAGEKLYVIKGFNLSGTPIYTKGAIVKRPEGEYFYFLVSSKIVTSQD